MRLELPGAILVLPDQDMTISLELIPQLWVNSCTSSGIPGDECGLLCVLGSMWLDCQLQVILHRTRLLQVFHYNWIHKVS